MKLKIFILSTLCVLTLNAAQDDIVKRWESSAEYPKYVKAMESGDLKTGFKIKKRDSCKDIKPRTQRLSFIL